jgi:hypothetical protein
MCLPLCGFDGSAEIGYGRNLFVGCLDDHVSILDTALGGSAIRVNVRDCHSFASGVGSDRQTPEA